MRARNPYLEQSIRTATPERLILALYDGAITAVDRAVESLEGPPGTDAVEVAHRELVRAQNIVSELRLCLDTVNGGGVARGLEALYGFCLSKLVEANVTKTPGPLAGVRQVLADIRDAWAQAVCAQAPDLQAVGGRS